MPRLVRAAIALSLFLSHGSWAKDSKCAEFLNAPAGKQIDFAMSDLESLFFDLVKKVEGANHVPAFRAEFYTKEILNMKAQILNRIFRSLPFVEKDETLGSIFQILDSMGVKPEMFGLELNDQGQVFRAHIPKLSEDESSPETKSPPMGFVTFKDDPSHELPEWLHRSIGFGPHEMRADLPPERVTGFIHREPVPKAPYDLKIVDVEKKKAYQADMRILTLFGFSLDGHKYTLDFNSEIAEWVVEMENHGNPTGKIGF